MTIRDLISRVLELAGHDAAGQGFDEHPPPPGREQELLAREYLYPGQNSVRRFGPDGGAAH